MMIHDTLQLAIKEMCGRERREWGAWRIDAKYKRSLDRLRLLAAEGLVVGDVFLVGGQLADHEEDASD